MDDVLQVPFATLSVDVREVVDLGATSIGQRRSVLLDLFPIA